MKDPVTYHPGVVPAEDDAGSFIEFPSYYPPSIVTRRDIGVARDDPVARTNCYSSIAAVGKMPLVADRHFASTMRKIS